MATEKINNMENKHDIYVFGLSQGDQQILQFQTRVSIACHQTLAGRVRG